MDAISRFALLLMQAYIILFALIGAHRLRRRYGLDLYFTLIGGLIVYMWWVTRLGIDALTIGDITLPVSTVGYFSSIFATLLVVYVSDGIRLTQRLILAVISLQAMFLILEVFTQLLLAVSPPLRFPLPEPFVVLHWRETVWSSVALVLDMLTVVVVYQFAQNRMPKISPMLKVWLALAIALALDSVVFVVGTHIGTDAFWPTMISQVFGKVAIAAAIAPVLSWYITRETTNRTAELGTLDIFRSVDLLTRSLHHTKTKYDALLSNSRDIVIVVNLKGFLVEANARFYDLLRYNANDLTKLHYTELIHKNERPEFVAALTVLLESGKSIGQRNIKAVCKNGQLLHIESNMQLLKEEDEKTGALLVWRDISDQVMVNSKLTDITELASLSKLKSSIIEHLTGLVEIQRQLGPDAPEASRAAQDVEALTRTLATLDEPENTPTRLATRELVDDALDFLKENVARGQIKIETSYGDPAPHVTGVRSRLMLALIHVLDNAIFWASKGDTPTVEIRSELVTRSQNRRRVEIRVINSGPAIPDDVHDRMYAPFYSSGPEKKSGLGLSVCRHVMQGHGGELNHRNTDDGRTEAVLSFPAEPRQPVTHTEVI
jgi:PAS domain S-box-containing protein